MPGLPEFICSDAYPGGSGRLSEGGDLAVGRRIVDRTEPEKGLESGHRGAAAVVAEDELVEVDGEMLV